MKALYARILRVDTETPRVLAMVREAMRGADGLVVDVGCGFGRYLKPMTAAGLRAVGVDASPAIVEANRAAGLQMTTEQALDDAGEKARVLLMSHVIEHFAPADLLQFLDRWLDRLQEGGALIVATPLLHPGFYDDFDHVRPYRPAGLLMVFGPGNPQVQYRGRNRLRLAELRIRREPWIVTLAEALPLGGPRAWPWHLLNVALALLFRASFGLLGRRTGWIGRFVKVAAP